LVGNIRVVKDKSQADGSRVRLADVEVGDETGTVSLRARDEQIDILRDVSERSGAIVLRNCMLQLFQGKHIRLAITKWGELSTYPYGVTSSTPPPPSKINQERNFSLVDLRFVQNDSAPQPNRRVQNSYQAGQQHQYDRRKGRRLALGNRPKTNKNTSNKITGGAPSLGHSVESLNSMRHEQWRGKYPISRSMYESRKRIAAQLRAQPQVRFSSSSSTEVDNDAVVEPYGVTSWIEC